MSNRGVRGGGGIQWSRDRNLVNKIDKRNGHHISDYCLNQNYCNDGKVSYLFFFPVYARGFFFGSINKQTNKQKPVLQN